MECGEERERAVTSNRNHKQHKNNEITPRGYLRRARDGARRLLGDLDTVAAATIARAFGEQLTHGGVGLLEGSASRLRGDGGIVLVILSHHDHRRASE